MTHPLNKPLRRPAGRVAVTYLPEWRNNDTPECVAADLVDLPGGYQRPSTQRPRLASTVPLVTDSKILHKASSSEAITSLAASESPAPPIPTQIRHQASRHVYGGQKCPPIIPDPPSCLQAGCHQTLFRSQLPSDQQRHTPSSSQAKHALKLAVSSSLLRFFPMKTILLVRASPG